MEPVYCLQGFQGSRPRSLCALLVASALSPVVSLILLSSLTDWLGLFIGKGADSYCSSHNEAAVSGAEYHRASACLYYGTQGKGVYIVSAQQGCFGVAVRALLAILHYYVILFRNFQLSILSILTTNQVIGVYVIISRKKSSA
jgi:hypothetical protein